MNRTVAAVAALAAVVAVSGCATKRYPIATQLTAAEVEAMDCDDIQLELVRAQQIHSQIVDTANVDWRSAAGFLGDFGIGNAMARSEADAAVIQRINGLRNARDAKGCDRQGGGAMAAIQNWVGQILG